MSHMISESSLLTGMNNNKESKLETWSFACPISGHVCLHIISSLGMPELSKGHCFNIIPVRLKQEKPNKRKNSDVRCAKMHYLNVLLKNQYNSDIQKNLSWFTF